MLERTITSVKQLSAGVVIVAHVTRVSSPTAFLYASSSYADVQYTGLEALYNLTSGSEWTTSDGWRNSALGVCNWYGVTCSDDGTGSSGTGSNVTELSLAGNGLIGDLSDATELLSDLESLQELDLSDNRLYGPVPLSLGLMQRLETLDLSGNELSYFPSTWGTGALALQYLSLQDNIISGSLPVSWLEVNDSSAYPLVHLESVSPWLPELRTLLLGGNKLNSTVYEALQAIAGWQSLQTCDMSGNELTGSVEDALVLYSCDDSGGRACGGNVSGTAGPLLRVLKLDGNSLIGQLPPIIGTGDRKIDVFDISDNGDVTGTIPETYSDLLMLFVNGTGLSGSALPSFVEAASGVSSSGYSSTHNLSVCPASQTSYEENIISVTLDPAYDDYSACDCNDGYEGVGGSCSECPLGAYHSLEEDAGDCLACPANATTLQQGRWRESQCVCSIHFYDELGGLGGGPSCVECPYRSRTVTAGATNITACECEPGYILDVANGVCEACVAGTYKLVYGNHASLCLPCPTGSYSEAVGATSSSICEDCPLGFYGNSAGASSISTCTECPTGSYGAVTGLFSESLCTACWAGWYSPTLGANSSSTCIECPSNHSQPSAGAGSQADCIPCSDGQVADQGSSQCTSEVAEDGTLVGLYLLIAGIFLVVFTLAWVFFQKQCQAGIAMTDKVHMKLNEEMKAFIFGQQFWISLFSGVEIIDLMSDLGAYASLLYTAALTGAMKIVYTIVVAFALVASLHGVHTRAIIILDMQEERTHGLAITGNNMLYYEKQFNLLQIMAQKRTCRRHVPFDRGNKYLCHHIGVQRLISLNSMRIIIAIFEDVPFLGLNMFLLMQQPFLADNPVFMISFVLSIFVLGYKMTLLEKHARLQIRKWNLEERMDTDTMLNKKAARGRRFSWACQQCESEGITPDAQKQSTQSLLLSTSVHGAGAVGTATKPTGGRWLGRFSRTKISATFRRSGRVPKAGGPEDGIGCDQKGAGAPPDNLDQEGSNSVSTGNNNPGKSSNNNPNNNNNSSSNQKVDRAGNTQRHSPGTAAAGRRVRNKGNNNKVLPSEGPTSSSADGGEGEGAADTLLAVPGETSSTIGA